MDPNLLTLQAFLLTLPQLDASLSDDLQQSVHKVGQDLVAHQPAIADEIRELVAKNDCLKTVYQQTYNRLEAEQQAVGQRAASLSTLPAAKPSWEATAVDVLTAPNPVAAARSMVRKMVATWRQAAIETNVLHLLDDLGNILAFLSQVAQQIEAQDIAILRAVRYNPRTVEDLSYTLGMPLEKVQAIVASLWTSGEIEEVNSSLWHRLLPMLKPEAHRNRPVDPHDYFTITLKGHFRLRPLFSVRPREGLSG